MLRILYYKYKFCIFEQNPITVLQAIENTNQQEIAKIQTKSAISTTLLDGRSRLSDSMINKSKKSKTNLLQKTFMLNITENFFFINMIKCWYHEKNCFFFMKTVQ